MKKAVIALLAAGMLTALLGIGKAGDGTVGLGSRPISSSQENWTSLPLPPVPHIDTMPWLRSGSLLRGPKVDILIGPAPGALGPFLLQPRRPPLQTFSDAGAYRAGERTE